MRTIATFLCCLAAGTAFAQTDANRQRCLSDDPDTSIAGCTAMIDSGRETGQNLATAYFNRGLAHRDKGNVSQAVRDYTEAIDRGETDPEVRFERGVGYFATGEYARAREDFAAAVKAQPGPAASRYLHLADDWLTCTSGPVSDRPGACDAVAVVAPSIVPQWLQANATALLNHRGLAYLALRQFDHALADFNQAVEQQPDAAALRNNRGRVYYESQQYAAAVAEFGEAIRLAPADPTPLVNRGMARAATPDAAAALADFDAALALNATLSAALTGRAIVLVGQNRADEANRAIDAALSLDPSDAGALYCRGVMKARRGDASGAEDFSVATLVQPEIAQAMARFGIAAPGAPSPATARPAAARSAWLVWASAGGVIAAVTLGILLIRRRRAKHNDVTIVTCLLLAALTSPVMAQRQACARTPDGTNRCFDVGTGGGSGSGGGSGGGGGSSSSAPGINRRAQAQSAAADKADAFEFLGDTALARGQYEDAIKAYDKALDAFYSDDRRRYYEGLKLKARGVWLDRELQRADEAYRAGQYEEMLRQLDRAKRAWYNRALQEVIDSWKQAMARDKFVSARAAAFCRAKVAAAADRKAWEQLGVSFESAVERFKEFEDVSTDQRDEMKNKAFDALLDHSVPLAEAAGVLNPWNVNGAIKELRATSGRFAPVMAPVEDALRRVAAAKNKSERAEAYKAYVEMVKVKKDEIATHTAMAKDEKNRTLHGLLGVLKIVQGNPALGRVVSGVEFLESAAYLAYLRGLRPGGNTGAIGSMVSITDDQLKQLPAMRKQLKEHVAARNNARQAWQKATGKTGEPVCAAQSIVAR
jgi:tetratricopeptide (TPR) repeat protein